MFIDPLYLVVMIASAALSLGAQAWVAAAVNRWKREPLQRGLLGVDIARMILDSRGLRNVRIEQSSGWLSDHYDPRAKVLRLSTGVFHGDSVAAAGIAAHESGHALQDVDGYKPMRMRQMLVPLANVGTNLGVIMVMIGLFIGALGLAKIGVALFAGFVVFTLVTLPVEIDASRRAKAQLASTGMLTQRELQGVSQVLRAAAGTYVAAAATSIMQLLYFVLRVSGGRRSEA